MILRSVEKLLERLQGHLAGRGVYNDETSGHVDNLCCFLQPGVVALTWTDDRTDPQHEISLDALQRLAGATDSRGRKLVIHKLHQPDPVTITGEEAQGIQSIPEVSRARWETGWQPHTSIFISAMEGRFYRCSMIHMTR